MKTTRKLLLALVLVMSILMTLAVAVIPASAANITTGTVLYLKPNSDWTTNNARFAAYFFGNGETWKSMEYVGGGYYKVDVPSGYSKVIFCRMNPSATANNWNNKWNQTGDLTIPTDGKDLFTVPSGSWDGATTTWSNLKFYVAGTSGLCGEAWNNSSDAMTDNGNGTWSYTYTNVSKANHELKITDGTWNNTWNGGSASTNFIYNQTKTKSTIKITFTLKTEKITVEETCEHGGTINTSTTPASCGTAGSTVKTCAECSTVISTTPIAALVHKDDNKDHVCDNGCDVPQGTCSDSATDKDHVCDYGCKKVLETCSGGKATCTAKAVCTVCGTSYGEFAAHEYTYSCDAHCKNCGELTNEEASHTTVHVEAKAPTCSENGNVEYWYCSVCGYAWLDVDCTIQTNLKAVVLGATCATNAVHNEGTEAGCSNTGLIENWYCATCDVYYLDAACTIITNYKNLTIPALNHNTDGVVAHKDATCKEAGVVGGTYCTRCDEGKAAAEASIPTLAHTGGTATCTAQAVCDVCGTSYGELAAHKYFYSCDAHCKNCGELTNEDASHDYVHVEAKAPICTENGNVEYWYCSVCGSAWLDVDCTISTNLKAVVLGATCATNAVHNEGTKAGCNTTGLIENWYCANCDVYYLDAACTIVTNYKNLTIPALGHSVGCGHAAEDAEGNLYGSVVEALSNGVSVTLVNNETVEELVINGAVLDLGGYTLTTKATIVFSGQIKGAGELVVDKGNFSVLNGATLTEVPVKLSATETTETFVFRAVEDQQRVDVEVNKEGVTTHSFVFKPSFAMKDVMSNAELFGTDGTHNNNISFGVIVSRTNANGTQDSDIIDVPDTLVYGTNKAFKMTLTGVTDDYVYSIRVVVIYDDTTVVYQGEIAYLNKKETN